MSGRKRRRLEENQNMEEKEEVEENRKERIIEDEVIEDTLRVMKKSKEEEGLYDVVVRLANDVYNEMGAGHLESVYHRAMEYALKAEGYFIESEVAIPFYYRDQYVGFGRADIIINRDRGDMVDRLILEFKAISSSFKYADICKLGHYMKHLKIDNGLMINFPQYNADGCKFKFI